MLKRSVFILFSFLVFCTFFMAYNAYAAPVGKITRLEGKVDVLKSGQQTVAGVSLGDNVDVGDIFRAKTNSRAEITFLNKNILRIHPATRVQISQYSDDGTRSNQIMKMDRGKVEAVSSREFVKKVSSFAEGNKFEVHTPNAVAGIRGSGMTVGFAQMVTGLFFSTGRGYFYNPNQPGIVRNVSAGFVSFVVGTGGLPSRPVPGNVSYVGGGTGTAPGSGGTTGNGLGTGYNIQTTGFINPINQTYTVTPPPPLEIPNVTVGSVPYLQGGFGNADIGMSVSINDVKFYGPSMTGQPTLWQAGSVSGNFRNLDGLGGNFGFLVTGSGMSSYVRVSGSDTDFSGTWTATIANGNASTGVGDYKQPFSFSGTASGTWNANFVSTGTLAGTASGVVPSTLTQDPIITQAIQVGYVSSISASGGPPYYNYMSMNQIKFWGPSTGAQPYAWTATIEGSRAVASPLVSANMSSSGVSPVTTATFVPNTGGAGSWTAYITNGNVAAGGMGSSPYNQTATKFDGKAAGTYTTSNGYYMVTGTASGKARP